MHGCEDRREMATAFLEEDLPGITAVPKKAASRSLNTSHCSEQERHTAVGGAVPDVCK